jgi:hypothetical protein
MAEALDQRAQQGGSQFRIDDVGLGEDLAEIAVDVGNAELLRDFRQIGDPLNTAGLLELRPGIFRLADGTYVAVSDQMRPYWACNSAPGSQRCVQHERQQALTASSHPP